MDDKVFKFRGKTIEEIQALSFEEFTEMLTSRLKRKLKRGFTEQEQIFLKKLRAKEKNIKTHCRDLFVLPEMIGEKISIYNGKQFVLVVVVPEMLCLRFGELVPTRKIGVKHSGGGAKKTVVRK
jgi:small subunit ribosomal protein S19